MSSVPSHTDCNTALLFIFIPFQLLSFSPLAALKTCPSFTAVECRRPLTKKPLGLAPTSWNLEKTTRSTVMQFDPRKRKLLDTKRREGKVEPFEVKRTKRGSAKSPLLFLSYSPLPCMFVLFKNSKGVRSANSQVVYQFLYRKKKSCYDEFFHCCLRRSAKRSYFNVCDGMFKLVK